MLTIGITAYREGEWLRQCWDSVLRQTSDEWKAIVVLDGNADIPTRRIFDSIEHPRVQKVQLSQNLGPYPTRELIFERSSNDVVLYIDADDYFTPRAVEIVAETFSDPEIAWAAVGAELFWENGERQVIKGHPITPERLIRHFEFPGYLLFRRSTWERLGRYDPKLKRGKADFDFCLRLLESKLPSRFVEDIVIQKRERAQSVGGSYHHRMGRVHERIVANNPKVFADPSLRSEFLNVGHLCSAWSCWRRGSWRRAFSFARRGVQYGGSRPYWPLNWGFACPRAAIQALVEVRSVASRTRDLLHRSR